MVHVFNIKWWLTKLPVRFGYEVFRLRRLDPRLPHHWVRKLAWLEPLFVGAWHFLLDIPQWRRYAVARRIPSGRQLLYFPLIVVLSMLARSTEIYGMYATILNPDRMEQFALSN